MTYGFSIGSLFLSGCALAASLYILGFALYGIRLRRTESVFPAPPVLPSFLVLIPAYNEAAGIGATVKSVLDAKYPLDKLRVVVIADNCSDATAEIARSCGAEVWQRNDPENPGKGQALEWAFHQVPTESFSFDFAAIIDADTLLDPGFFREIATSATADQNKFSAAVYQGRYEFSAVSEKTNQWFETFTLASKAAENSFVYLPRSAAGLVTLLQGNGFCISRAALQRVPFRAGSVVEDAEYAVALAQASVPVRYVDAARVWARMTASVRDAAPQRVRWASGIFWLLGSAVPQLVQTGLRKRSWRLIEAALMVLLTSRVLLVSLTFFALLFAVLLPSGLLAHVSLIVACTATLLQAIYLTLMFREAGDYPYPMTGLVWAPLYFLFISFMQALALAGFRRKRWTRTVR